MDFISRENYLTSKDTLDAARISSNDVDTAANNKWIVCYHTNWSQYRNTPGKFYPEDIDGSLCTHLIYSFSKMCKDSSGWTMCPYEWNDMDESWAEGMYTRFNNKKVEQPHLKTLLAVGGWNHGSTDFTAMLDEGWDAVRTWAKNSIQYCLDTGFDGLDLDWEYPAKETVDVSPQKDYERFQRMVEIVREEVNRVPGFLLTAAVGIGVDKIYHGPDGENPSYNVKNLSDNLDMINLMAYDIHGHWEDKTGHHAPAHNKMTDTRLDYTDSLEWIVENWLVQGADPQKLALGLAAYGRSFKLEDPNNNGYMAPVKLNYAGLGSGTAGQYTGEGGFLSYYEICDKLLRNGWRSIYDNEIEAPYAYGEGDWVGYDNPTSIVYKAKMAEHYGLGGIMWWAIDLDDFTGSFCGQGKYPLMTAAKNYWHNGYTTTTGKPISTQSTSTSGTGSTPTSSPGGDCVSGQFYPHPELCDHYYLCDNGGNVDFTCPPGTYWDTANNYCDFANTIDCCNGQRPCNQ
ncbi:unnamed protein product [Oikopleura dioica]|uniref:chitinase n=1 Tax=Oikopleura dioica TaxID=34765 RepID=E4XT41_OIKDI|nr:unnamed protein product [Oikopleura dioica]